MNALENALAEAVRTVLASELQPIVRELAALRATSKPAPHAPDRLLSKTELADFLGVDARTVRALELSGSIPAAIRAHRRAHPKWLRSQIEQWAASRGHVEPKPKPGRRRAS